MNKRIRLLVIITTLFVMSMSITVPTLANIKTDDGNYIQISNDVLLCTKCGKDIHRVDSFGNRVSSESQLAKAFGLTLCLQCWQDVLNGSDRSDAITKVAQLGEDGRVLSSQLPSSQGSPTWGSITGTLSTQQDLQSILDGKLSYFTELDPLFGGSVAHDITSGDITNWNNKLSSYTETDSVVKSLSGIITSNGSSISSITNNSANWNTAVGWGNHANYGYLQSVTGVNLDNVWSTTGLLKRTGIATYTVDASTYLTGNQSITLSGDLSGSGTTSISGTVTGIKGVTLPTLAMGYLYYSGSAWSFQTPAGGSNPAWYGKLYATRADCNPITQAEHENMLSVAAPTPTNITVSLARCVQFTPPANITVTNIRLFGVGITTNLYKFAIYPVGTSTVKVWDSGTVTTAANTWLNITTGMPITLTAGTKYWWCVTAVAIGTVAGFRSEPAPLGTNYWGANAAPLGGTSLGLPVYAQFAVSTGVFPTNLPTIAAAAYSGGTTGTVPYGWLDYGGSK
jgi:hypothetical protein